MKDNFFLRGLRWLNKRQEEYSSVIVEYDDGINVLAISAVVGRIAQEEMTDEGAGYRTLFADGNSFLFDFIIRVKDLAGLPRAGDRIRVDERHFEVVNSLNGRCYNYVDNTFEFVRVHAQLIVQTI